MTDNGRGRQKVITALDIGASKVVCIIAVSDGDKVTVAGVGKAENFGIKKGVIVERQSVINAIKKAVELAERGAEYRIKDVLVSLSGLNVKSYHIYSDVNIDYGKEIKNSDLNEALEKITFASNQEKGIFCIPINCIIDGQEGIKNPIGMYGLNLGVVFNLITVNRTVLNNLESLIEECHLNIKGIVVNSHASGLACLSDDDKLLGTTIIDIGAESISVGLFEEDVFKSAVTIPIGANVVTQDIARGLNISLDKAEKLKTAYGSAIKSPADDLEEIPLDFESDNFFSSYVSINPFESSNSVKKSRLVRIIHARMKEVLEFIKTYSLSNGLFNYGNRIVLTGGGAKLMNLSELAEKVFGKNVKIAIPKDIKGIPENFKTPAFATTLGILLYGANKSYYDHYIKAEHTDEKESYLKKIKNWIKEKL